MTCASLASFYSISVFSPFTPPEFEIPNVFQPMCFTWQVILHILNASTSSCFYPKHCRNQCSRTTVIFICICIAWERHAVVRDLHNAYVLSTAIALTETDHLLSSPYWFKAKDRLLIDYGDLRHYQKRPCNILRGGTNLSYYQVISTIWRFSNQSPSTIL